MPDLMDETTALLIIAAAKREAQAATAGLGDMVNNAVTGLVERQVKDAIGGGIIAERVEYIRGTDGRDVEFTVDGSRIGVRYVRDGAEFVYTGDLTGPKGDSIKGDKGDSIKGDDGRGITGARLDGAGNLMLAMSDGTEASAGLVPTAIGDQGVGIASATITGAGRLVFTLTDGTKIDAGLVRPKDGQDGEDGEDGRSVEFDVRGDRIGLRYEGEERFTYTSSLRGWRGGGGGGLSRQSVIDIINENPSGIAGTFETVNKNLDAANAVLAYNGNADLETITYASGVVKTFAYASGDLISITLSGATPDGIDLIKTLTYTGGNLTGVTYS